jgi:hypothetical protein
MMSTLARAAVVAAVAMAGRVDDDVEAKPARHHHAHGLHHEHALHHKLVNHQALHHKRVGSHHKQSPEQLAQALLSPERAKEMEAQSLKVADAYAAAHKVAVQKVTQAQTASDKAKSLQKQTIDDVALKEKNVDFATAEDKAAKASLTKAEEARDHADEAWGRAKVNEMQAEAAHAKQHSLMEELVAASEQADAHMAKTKAHRDATNQTAAASAAAALDAESKLNSLVHQQRALTKKTHQISTRKVITTRIAQDALKKQRASERHRAKLEIKARKAAKTKESADEREQVALEDNEKEADIMNLKTGVAFRAMHDKVVADVEAKHHGDISKAMHRHDTAVRNAVYRDLPHSEQSSYQITHGPKSAATNGPYDDAIADAINEDANAVPVEDPVADSEAIES